MIIISDINKLHASVAPICYEFLALAMTRGLDIRLFETYRSLERQAELYKKGYTKLKKGSMHQYGAAFDIVFNDREPWGPKHPWQKLGQVGRDLGLYWGGDWRGAWDKPHFQIVPANYKYHQKIRKGKFPPLPMPTLKKGHYGDQVIILQYGLNKWVANLAIDGDFGRGTEKAVKILQTKLANLTVDGVCRHGTWKGMV